MAARRAREARQPFKLLRVSIRGDRVMNGFRDAGPLAGAHVELIEGEAARPQGAVTTLLAGAPTPGEPTLLLSFPDGSYLERKVSWGMVQSPQKCREILARARAEVQRFNLLATQAAARG
jgi:hypothetical protein